MERKLDSKIFQIIDEIEEYISNCKPKLFSADDIIVNRDTMEEYLRELKTKAPDEIEKYRKIIRNQEAILNDAKDRAQNLLDQTMAQSDEMISQNEIMKRAYEQADQVVKMADEQAQAIVDQAAMEANSLREAATQYMEDCMMYLEDVLSNASQSATNNYNELIKTLNHYNDKIRSDHNQLHPQPESAPAAPVEEPAPAQEAEEEA